MRELSDMHRLGRAFGFPPCCCKAFCDALRSGVTPPSVSGDGPWTGTGFIPCPDHAILIRREGMDGTVRQIQSDRIVPHSFPGTPDQDAAFVEAFLAVEAA